MFLVRMAPVLVWLFQDLASSSASECKDKFKKTSCEMFKKFDACRLSVQTMKRGCKKTCDFCVKECKDRYPTQCMVWKKYNSCVTHRHLLKKWCKKTCGHCRSNSPPVYACSRSTFGCCWDKKTKALGPNGVGCPVCYDKLSLCWHFKEDCVRGRNKAFVLKNCPRTCNICGALSNQGRSRDVYKVDKKRKP